MGLLSGRTAFVTGGSRGLGRALCLAFAREGANVAFNYLRADVKAAEVLEAIRAFGVRGWSFKAPVTDKARMAEVVATVEGDGGIDILVNNAGTGQVVPLALMEEQDWVSLLDVHLKGAFICTQAVLRGMVKRRYGRVLNMGSLAGVKMMQAPVHYATAKAGLKGFTESLAKEIGRFGITVNCLAPGILDDGVSTNLPPARLGEYLQHCALGRLGTPAEAAEVAAFMVSEKNSYMNGATVVLDGGV